AMAHNLQVFQPRRVREPSFIETIKQLSPDVIVVIAFGQILPKAFLEIPQYGCINVHASLLPKYRGAAPIQWCIINGEVVTGITTMFMDVGIDTGDMLLKTEIEIAQDETGGSLHDRLQELGGPLLLQTLDQLEQGSAVRQPQIHEHSIYAPMLDKKLGEIDWNKSAVEIERLIRGLAPWPSAYTYLDGKILKLWKAEVVSTTAEHSVGTLCDIQKNEGFTIQCGQEGLLIKELQLQGKNKMDGSAFLRGAKLNVGSKFGQPV
ncbi:MAG: methionyl-tRNA formyltransferase, partial [Vallitaleaceae bacterium]|nr:methionyl-tRNA formyltransferase [Vallitaleaceae bacterium]